MSDENGLDLSPPVNGLPATAGPSWQWTRRALAWHTPPRATASYGSILGLRIGWKVHRADDAGSPRANRAILGLRIGWKVHPFPEPKGPSVTLLFERRIFRSDHRR